MLLSLEINTELSINSLMDLKKLKSIDEISRLKINKSRLADQLGCDRRTVTKYINGYQKPIKRKRPSQFDNYYQVIKMLLEHPTKVFYYKRVLWQYLKDNYGLEAPESSFRRYIRITEEFNKYFSNKKRKVGAPTAMRFESEAGKQAQMDWKESMNFQLRDGEWIQINIFVLLLSYSRFRVYHLSLSKSRDILLHFLNRSFESIGGVPHEILTDNPKTIMDSPRTEYQTGRVNSVFQGFADDYGFLVKPCIAARPETKAKVESPMKILDELYAYNSELSYEQLARKLQEINDRENHRFHKDYQSIPILSLAKEKGALLPLPNERIRHQYSIGSQTALTNASSMIRYKNHQYSVPPKYIGKRLTLQVYDNQLHVYFSTELITIHKLSHQPLNYHVEHYIDIAKKTLPHKEEDIKEIALNNLKKIGERYND